MILQALKEYSERIEGLPEYGFSREQINYRLVINMDGSFCSFTPCEEHERIEVPNNPGVGKTSGIVASFLWGDTEYIFGIKPKKKYKDTNHTEKTHKAFLELNRSLCESAKDDAMKAVLSFLKQIDSIRVKHINELEMAKNGKCLLILNNEGEIEYIQNRQAVRNAWLNYLKKPTEKEEKKKSNNDDETSFCLVTGKQIKIARLHQPKIVGVGKKPGPISPACLVGFDDPAFCSYGKTPDDRGMNAPVSKETVAAYTAALNYLLDWKNGQTIRIGDAQTVFWAAVPTKMEQAAPLLLGGLEPQMKDDPGKAKEIKDYLKAIKKGNLGKFEAKPDTRYYILGLNQPNKSRIAVRFWFVTTVKGFADNMKKHFDNIAIEKHFEKDNSFPGMKAILHQLKPQKSKEELPKEMIKVSGDLMHSILSSTNYPNTLLAQTIGRIRAGEKVNYLRAAMIKGILTRNHKMEVSMSLDLANKEPAYLLGRLFAVLEKAQRDALGDINATIKDKYFSSASATPCAVFPILLNLNKHHTSKGEHGGYYDDLNAKIMEELPAKKFPTHLRLEEQGLFSIGYYHQRNDFYKSECACGHRFSSFDASEKPNEKAKSGHRIVACPKCGGSVEVKKQKSKEDKQQESETN